jgi:hypothetical protein
MWKYLLSDRVILLHHLEGGGDLAPFLYHFKFNTVFQLYTLLRNSDLQYAYVAGIPLFAL